MLREEGTEWAGTSPLNKEKRKGTYACVGCDLVLYTSAAKFDSGTGWPSFWECIPGHLEFGRSTPRLSGTGCSTRRCTARAAAAITATSSTTDPQPTGLRYCSNGVVLKFLPA